MVSPTAQETDGTQLSEKGPQNFAQEFVIGYITDLERVVDDTGVDEEFGKKWYAPEMRFQNTNGAVYTGEQVAAWGYDLFAPFSLVAHSIDSIVSIGQPDGTLQVHVYGKRILKLKENKANFSPDFTIPFASKHKIGPAAKGSGFKGYQWHEFFLYWDTAPLYAVLSADATVFQKENPMAS